MIPNQELSAGFPASGRACKHEASRKRQRLLEPSQTHKMVLGIGNLQSAKIIRASSKKPC